MWVKARLKPEELERLNTARRRSAARRLYRATRCRFPC